MTIVSHAKRVLLSGVKPTGRPHLGNYFGAMKQFADLQEQYQTYIMIADYHAFTTVHDPAALKQNVLDLAIDYLTVGLDPERVVLFKQSAVPEHAELAWIFNCIVTVPYLMRSHAYKAAAAKNKEVTVGTFDYPMLMAADILLYDADVVPIGLDQKQHLEYARDMAEKFNRLFGKTFKLPEPLILSEVQVVAGLDGRKMSKSYNNTIPLFASGEEVKKSVMSIKTDSKDVNEPKNPEQCNIFAFHKLFSQKQLPELKRRYAEGGIGYKESKEILIENMNKVLAPWRERRVEIAADETRIKNILAEGAVRARKRTSAKMTEVRKKIGVGD